MLPGVAHDHPGVHYAGQRFYGRMLRAGVRIFEFQSSFIHAKFTLVDDWVSLGSCNFDHWSLQWNLEANQEVEDPRFAVEVADLFERNFATSHEALDRVRGTTELADLADVDLVIEAIVEDLDAKKELFGTLDGMLTRLR